MTNNYRRTLINVPLVSFLNETRVVIKREKKASFDEKTEITWQPSVHSEVFHFNSLKSYCLRKPLTATVPAEAFHRSFSYSCRRLDATLNVQSGRSLRSMWMDQKTLGAVFVVESEKGNKFYRNPERKVENKLTRWDSEEESYWW